MSATARSTPGASRHALVAGIVFAIVLCVGAFLILMHLQREKYDRLSMCTALISAENSAIAYYRAVGYPPDSIEQLIDAGYIRSYYDKDRGDEYTAFAPAQESYAKWKHVRRVKLAFPSRPGRCVLKGHVLTDMVTGNEYFLVCIPGFETPPNISERLGRAWLDALQKDHTTGNEPVGSQRAD